MFTYNNSDLRVGERCYPSIDA